MTVNTLFKKNIIKLLVFCFALTSCNNNKQQQEDLQQAVIAKHDSVMLNMGVLMEKKSQLNAIANNLDSLKTVKPMLDTLSTHLELKQTVKLLSGADDQMMSWMNNFNPDYTGKSHEQVMSYLRDQQAKITFVDKSMKRIILKSDSIIHKYK